MSSATKAPGAEGPGAYGIPGLPDRLSQSDQLRIFSAYYADRLPAEAAAELCELADEWDEQIASAPAPSDPAGAGGDLGELERLSKAVDEFIAAERAEDLARAATDETAEALRGITQVSGASLDDVRAGLDRNRVAHDEVMVALSRRQNAEVAMKDALRAAHRSGQLVASTPGQKGAGEEKTGACLTAPDHSASPSPQAVSALTGECSSRGPAVSAEPTGWAWEFHAGQGNWSTTISDFRPSDASWRRNIRPLYEHPPAFAAAIPSGEWQPISEAPLDTEVEVRVGQMTFLAKLVPGAAMDTNESVCDQWQATREGEHPPCWSDGCCWTVNEDENCSLWPEAWRPALGTEAEGQDAKGSLVHEGPADVSATPAQTPPSPPSATPEGDPPMTVEEAREVLNSFDTHVWPNPADYVSYLRKIACEVPHRPQYQQSCRTFASRIELALRTLHAAGEVRHG